MKWERVLITGSTGLVGKAVINHFQAMGITCLSIGRDNRCNYVIDLSQENLDLAATIPQPDCVVHLAAAVPRGNHCPDNQTAYRATRWIDRNVLTACRRWDCPVVYASGCSLYRNRGSEWISETDRFKDELASPYLRAKAEGDAEYCAYAPGTVLRISCPIGPGVSRASVFGRFLNQLETTGIITIFGTGSREQDFIDTRDIAASILSVVDRNAQGSFNIASGSPTTMRFLADILVERFGGGEIIIGQQEDPQEGLTARYSISRANEVLDWHPQYSLQESLNWIKEKT